MTSRRAYKVFAISRNTHIFQTLVYPGRARSSRVLESLVRNASPERSLQLQIPPSREEPPPPLLTLAAIHACDSRKQTGVLHNDDAVEKYRYSPLRKYLFKEISAKKKNPTRSRMRVDKRLMSTTW